MRKKEYLHEEEKEEEEEGERKKRWKKWGLDEEGMKRRKERGGVRDR